MLEALWKTKEWSDVTIVLQDTTRIKAHRFVLATNSSYFNTLLRETAVDEIPSDSDADVMNSLLEYWYLEKGKEEYNLSNSQLVKLVILAIKVGAEQTAVDDFIYLIDRQIQVPQKPLDMCDFIAFANFTSSFKNQLVKATKLHERLCLTFLKMKTYDVRLNFSIVASWITLFVSGYFANVDVAKGNLIRFGNYCLAKPVPQEKSKPLMLDLLSYVQEPLLSFNLDEFGISQLDILEIHLLRNQEIPAKDALHVSKKERVSSTEWSLTMKLDDCLVALNDYEIGLNDDGTIYDCRPSKNYVSKCLFGVVSSGRTPNQCLLENEEDLLFYLDDHTHNQMRTVLEYGVRLIQFRGTETDEWVTVKQDNNMCHLLVVAGFEPRVVPFLVGDEVTCQGKDEFGCIQGRNEDAYVYVGNYRVTYENRDVEWEPHQIEDHRVEPVELFISAQ